jgi:hypothetical protein
MVSKRSDEGGRARTPFRAAITTDRDPWAAPLSLCASHSDRAVPFQARFPDLVDFAEVAVDAKIFVEVINADSAADQFRLGIRRHHESRGEDFGDHPFAVDSGA